MPNNTNAQKEIDKPIKRGRLRQILGREFYILKRKFNWILSSTKWAKQSKEEFRGYSVFKHKSIILRHLKDVDMYLQENKRVNLELAIKKLDSMLIKPGETLSIWKNVGRPTRAKGYLEGLSLKNGKISKDIGGGLCQLGNLLFWIFAHSPLTITERHRHGFDVFPDANRKVPFGAGATLSYNHIDLQVKNETNQNFYLKLWLDDRYLHGELFSQNKPYFRYRVVEKNHIFKQQIWGGYSRHNEIYKIIEDEDGIIKESLLVRNDAIVMYSPILKGTSNNRKN